MGGNLVPIVRKFKIEVKTFAADNCAVKEGCVQKGTRKLLRFDFLCWNAGNKDLRMGSPQQNPQWYEFSPCHSHYHLKDFNTFKLISCKGRHKEWQGKKQAFCLEDSEKRSTGRATAQFKDCNSNQGISAGWADLYFAALDCQWVDITGVPDGEYVLEALTNSNYIVKEDWYGDNVTWAGLQITGNTVKEIPITCYPEDCIPFNPKKIQIKKINGTYKVVEGTHWILDFGSSKSNATKARKIIQYYRMDEICFVGRPSRTRKQLMMYFMVNGRAPSGAFAGDDSIPFNNANVTAQNINGSWKVVDGNHWMLDFGMSEANALKAVWIIKKYGFRFICFVGRPNAPMMYFRK